MKTWAKIKEHWIQNVLIVLLIAAVGLIGYKVNNISPNGSAVVNKSGDQIVFIPGGLNNYFIPQIEQSRGIASAGGATSASTSTSTGKSAISEASGSSLDLAFDSELYQYTSANLLNASAGVRDLDMAVSEGITSKAHAAMRKYSVVYSVGGSSSKYPGYNKIYEFNIQSGDSQVVVEEPEGAFIRSVDFSSKNQSIVYAVASKEQQNVYQGNYRFDIKVKNLNSNKETVVARDKYGVSYSKWSKDGKSVLAGAEGGTIEQGPASIIFWSSETKELKECPSMRQGTKAVQTISPRYTYWADNGDTAITLVTADQNLVNVNGIWETIYHPLLVKKSDCSWTEINTADSARDPHTGGPVAYPLKVGSKVISFNYAINELGQRTWENFPNPSDWGWLSFYDLNSHQEANYKDKMGDMLDNWIINAAGNKLVYVVPKKYNYNDPYDLKVIDLGTGAVKNLSTPPIFYKLVGWNGDENNALLWDAEDNFYNVNINSGKITKINRNN